MAEPVKPAAGAAPVTGPRRPRFVLLTDLPARISRPILITAPKRVTWRLIAANNRSIGQASEVFASVADCLGGIEQLVAGAAGLSTSVLFHPGTASGASSHWRWTVSSSGRLVACSSHQYRRRVECERALNFFTTVLRARPQLPRPGSYRRLGHRLGASTS